MRKEAGVLLHISSLPNCRGIGSLGKEAYEFIDFLSQAKQGYWQVLPLGQTSYGDSPYQSPSAYAGNPYFISLDILCDEGLLKAEELPTEKCTVVDYGNLFETRYLLLLKAFNAFSFSRDFNAFCAENAFWLEDYAIFMAIKKSYDYRSFYEWESGLRLHDEKILAAFASNHKQEIDFWKFLQYEFFRQYARLKSYANFKNIRIIGDMPIYVALDSVEVWASPHNFLLDNERKPTFVAGVPPDAFTADGQLWGNPLYDWQTLKADGYDFWKKRLAAALKLFDLVRIDHFRGFESYFAVPFGEKTARNGVWKKGPAMDLFDELKKHCDTSRIIAEDLGYLTKVVRDFLKATGFAGMKVAQFGFDFDLKNEYLPKNYPENCVAYTGTHDNMTTRQFIEALTAKEKEYFDTVLSDFDEKNDVYKLIAAVMQSKAALTVIPMQDWLNLGKESRMNYPSKTQGYWQWRLEAPLQENLAQSIAAMTEKYGRKN